MCKKFVEIEIEATCGGDDWITIKRPCASTGPFGELLLCDECESTRGSRLINSDEPEDAGYMDY